MKIGIVQTKPVKGDVVANLADHQKWIGKAVERGVDLLVFPELSITGYEPTLARELATTKEDERFDAFQWMSDKYGIVIGMGMPIWASETDGDRAGGGEAGVMIGMIIFQPDGPRRVYAKQYLHADEVPFFVPGNEQVFLSIDDNRIALSLCYELSVPEHSVNAYSNRANIYLSSSAKTAEGMDKALNTLTGIACTYSMIALISNSVGPCDGAECGGQSAVMNDKGEVLAKLGSSYEGMLIYDTATGKVTQVSGTTRDRLTA
ncbi:carbon-nitrogen hydrolase family protein [Puia dinghuensis]|uniref:Hydrolase n=1 Tax=Puia dinghuensis TaxID=1792502 RepID=A0A8J2XWA0_9BACT|nr:carbon-nitrogen hydrolase family protein [Puia dinghuensis]GGB18059.1 hydrolase [Puia dinghuensis]